METGGASAGLAPRSKSRGPLNVLPREPPVVQGRCDQRRVAAGVGQCLQIVESPYAAARDNREIGVVAADFPAEVERPRPAAAAHVGQVKDDDSIDARMPGDAHDTEWREAVQLARFAN